MTAIRESVSTELCRRDTEKYNIPPDGKVTTMVTDSDGKESFYTDPVKVSQVHCGRDHRTEVKRRWQTFVKLRPDPAHAFDWVRIIGDDDGLGSDGQPLCQEHGGHRDSTKPDYQTGFTDELPKWLRSPPPDMILSEVSAEPVPVVTPIPTVQTADETASVVQVTANGCPECHGPPYGKGFRHIGQCSRSTVRTKA
jgi:hypothetical protein